MGLNESRGDRSTLSRKQKNAALAAILGIPDPLDESEAETIRLLLADCGRQPNPSGEIYESE